MRRFCSSACAETWRALYPRVRVRPVHGRSARDVLAAEEAARRAVGVQTWQVGAVIEAIAAARQPEDDGLPDR